MIRNNLYSKLLESGTVSQWKYPPNIVARETSVDLFNLFVDFLEERLRSRLNCCESKPFGLATGRTMKPIYDLLVHRLYSWPSKELEKLIKGWVSFNLDEYIGLSRDDQKSFSFFMANHLGNPLNLSYEKMHIPNGNAKDPHLEACQYTQELLNYGGISFQLLGLGINGHIGFNEPPCDFKESCRVVELTEDTKRQNASSFYGEANSVPSYAITLGLREILDAEEIHLIVVGEKKS